MSTNTKSETKLGIEHLNIASLPTMTLSLRMSISNLWVVTAMKEQKLKLIYYLMGSIFNAVFVVIFTSRFLPLEPSILASESIQESTKTKSVTKLGIEHLKIASLPTIMLSGEMLISYLWFVTVNENKSKHLRFKFHAVIISI